MSDSYPVGAKVVWKHSPKGGYGYTFPVAGIVVRPGGDLTRIQIAEKSPLTGEWRKREKTVRTERLFPRAMHVPQLDGDK